MLVHCPHCGRTVEVRGFGRKPSDIGVTEVCDTLQLCHSVPAAAEKLGCSRALVYKIVKANGLKLKDVISGKRLATKDTTLLYKGADSGGR